MAEFRARANDAGRASVPEPVRQPVIAVPPPPIDLNSGNLPENHEELFRRLTARVVD
ncbi:hypothetical protein FACS1894139_04320 [Planctomycetales bacterium]|nr:hypothetical protein FACS1894107_01980 [Planctomycetales bacterium]GHS99200.1 hypothetical protein FACS1894108_08730 [Planctomycetales bacterium]GHT03623.1 hypothetical protein FACS1894139_04320 [Planctomycetales bacterium]